MKFDYGKMYATQEDKYFDWVHKAGLWKAQKLCELISNEETNSILEIGTGTGDVLNACRIFKKRVGADILTEAIQMHRNKYSSHHLVKIDTNASLPFERDEFDFALLCDILEHVKDPIKLLKEAARVGKNVMLKIPVEKALLINTMNKIRSVTYGAEHPSGHLHCWNLQEILEMIDKSELTLSQGKFINTPITLIKKKNPIKTFVFLLVNALDVFTHKKFFARLLIGGSFFAIVKKNPKVIDKQTENSK